MSPPAAVPPKHHIKGQCDFRFDRLGVRVPMVMVSSHIARETIESGHYDHTSFIRTLDDFWNIGSLTDRDKTACSFSNIFTEEKREAGWPDIKEPYISPKSDLVDYNPHSLNDLQKSILRNLPWFVWRVLHDMGNPATKEEMQQDIQRVESITNVGEALTYTQELRNKIGHR